MVSIQFFFVSSFLSSMIRRFHWYAITCVCGYILISECAIWYHHYCCCYCCCFWPRSYHYKGDALMCVCSWALGPFVFIELHFRRNSLMNACHFYQSSFNLSNVRHITIFLILFFHFFPPLFLSFFSTTRTHASFTYLNFFITIFGIVCWYRIVDINFKFGSAREAPQIRCHFLCQWWTPFARIPFTFI